jgi:hypothetical protein
VSDPELRHTLTLLVAHAEQLTHDLDERSRLVSERLETWFNDRMARAVGWYKRLAQAFYHLKVMIGMSTASAPPTCQAPRQQSSVQSSWRSLNGW